MSESAIGVLSVTMIIRRFVIALRQQDWATVAIEFLIVVVGIFVGLQVDDWNQDRQARSREVVALTAIKDEIEDNVERLSSSISHVESSHSATQEFFTHVGGEPISPPAMDELLSRIGVQARTALSSSAIEALLLSGKLAEVSNASLRQEIISLRERYTSHREIELYNGDIIEENFVAALTTSISMIGIHNSLVATSGYASPIVLPDNHEIDNRHLLNDQLIQNLAASLKYTLRMQILSSEKLSEDLAQIASQIDAHLKHLQG